MQTESVLNLIEQIEKLEAELRQAQRDAQAETRKRWAEALGGVSTLEI